MIVSQYWVTFTVLECGYGMELLNSYYILSDNSRVPASVVQVR